MYAQDLKERFGTNIFQDSIVDLVLIRQQGSVDLYHDQFVNIFTQIRLSKSYALSVFVSNLKEKIRKYLQHFRPRTLVEAFHIARQVEDILKNTLRKGFLSGGYTPSKFTIPL